MPNRVLIPQPIADEGMDFLRERGYKIKIGRGLTVDIMKEDVLGCDAILMRTAQLPAEVLQAGKRLKVIGRHGVGVDNIDLKAATELGIYVTNAPESNANSVAEHTIGLIIACAKNLTFFDRQTRRGNFGIRDQVRGVDLDGKIIGIVGFGAIGSIVAKKAILGFGMRVMVYDPYVDTDDVTPEVILVHTWEELFQTVDFVTLHLPSTPTTKGVVGMNEFEMMKPTAYLINTSRGDIVNEAELIEALQERLIAGAGLDVYAQEPPAAHNPLLQLENVVLTPHNAALTKECAIRTAIHAAMGIDAVLSGRKPKWPVNKPELASYC
jgi:D-3-phosphoglycerate dehydrogenase